MEFIYNKESARILPSSSVHLGGSDLAMKLRMTKEIAEQKRDSRMKSINQKMKEKEDLYQRREQQRQFNMMVNHEEFLLKVKNKEINRER